MAKLFKLVHKLIYFLGSLKDIFPYFKELFGVDGDTLMSMRISIDNPMPVETLLESFTLPTKEQYF